jgi:hypothetical protein
MAGNMTDHARGSRHHEMTSLHNQERVREVAVARLAAIYAGG